VCTAGNREVTVLTKKQDKHRKDFTSVLSLHGESSTTKNFPNDLWVGLTSV